MAVAQGIYKRLAYKKQTALGTAASGSGGQYLRRETASFNKTKDTFNSDEITGHQQYTGDTYGVSKVEGQVSGVLSAATYANLLGSLCRKDMTATAAITGLSLTIAGSGPFTLTRSAGSWLTDGVRVGDVVRITAGTYTGTARDINLLVTAVATTVLTVIVPNAKTLTAQGPIASSTVTVIGKKSVVPVSGHTNDYYTFEEWSSDISRSRTYTDCQIASAEVSIPASGNATIQLNVLGLGRAKGSSQVLTTPTAETTTTILTAANAKILLAGTDTLTGTSMNLTIDGGIEHGEAVIGSKTISDLVKGDVRVSGSVTKLHEGETVSDLFDNETALKVIAVLFADTSDTSEFVGFTVPRAKLFSDERDDGKKQLVQSHNFTAEYNSGNASDTSSDAGIISIQDSSVA